MRIAFDIRDGTHEISPGYSHVELMVISDIKLGVTKKAQLVARRNRTETPVSLTYSSVVSRESVRITFLMAVLNKIDIFMFEIGNAYLNAKIIEKLYIYAGPEFGADEEKLCIIIRALYGLKNSSAAYRNHFAQSLIELGFDSCYADADVWRRPGIKKDGRKYYEYLLSYADDCILVCEETGKIIETLKGDPYNYILKDVGPPAKY